MASQTYAVLGKRHVRKGVPEKATGAAKYTADLSFPDMLIGAVLGSPLAHARILNIDTSRAQALPGVKAVLTAKETGAHQWGHSPARYDETTLAVDKVRHVGDQIAAVAAIAMIVAEVLGLTVNDVDVVSGDTGECPVDLGAYSSRQTLMTGHATKKAAEAVKAQILGAVAEIFELPADAFTLRDGLVLGTEEKPDKLKMLRDQYRREHRAFVDLPGEGPLTFQEINRQLYNTSGPVLGKGTYAPGEIQEFKDWKGSAVGSSPAYSTQTCIAEVAVDTDTGQLTVEKVTLAHDCGFALNRTAVEGQMEGSMCHGLSETLFEEMLFDDKGQLINRTLGDYKIATALDVPELEAVIIETNEPAGPFGAKEVGEGCIIPVLPAIINAIYDACGVVIMDLPVTSEKILRALKAKEAAKSDRYVTEIPASAMKQLDLARDITKQWEQKVKK
jgi:CO/xanthine dehydrogenase Mo-binding subunit